MSYPGHSLGGVTPMQRSSRCILQPQPTGQSLELQNRLEVLYMMWILITFSLMSVIQWSVSIKIPGDIYVFHLAVYEIFSMFAHTHARTRIYIWRKFFTHRKCVHISKPLSLWSLENIDIFRFFIWTYSILCPCIKIKNKNSLKYLE